MIVSGEFNEVGYTTISVGAGQSSFTTSGTYSWTVPTNVVTISVVAVGGGGGGPDIGSGGGGGALAYVNDISVTPGETLIVGVGTSGLGANTPGVGLTATDGGNSYVKRGATSLVEAGGGKRGITATLDAPPGAGGMVIVGTGGIGGAGAPGDTGGGIQGSGGGGAGGYSGAGGQGGQSNFGEGFPGSGGGGGGGNGTSDAGSGGGGVGIFGQGESGLQGNGGGGGSGGIQGQPGSASVGGSGGLYGGGGGGGDGGDTGGNGAPGAVRIIWGFGANRYFPSINTIDLPENYTTVKAGINGLGTYTALEFTENVGITTTLTANIFAPYDLVYDEFGGVLFGPGQGRLMRQNLTGDVIVYNEIDEVGLSTSYGIATESLSIGEGGTITFTISANNVPDGTEIYYEIV
jgi:hypothetical protein